VSRGIVYLVGAGPGDPGLLTIRGRELLGSCDDVVYDALVSEELLTLAVGDRDVGRHFVGKRGGDAGSARQRQGPFPRLRSGAPLKRQRDHAHQGDVLPFPGLGLGLH